MKEYANATGPDRSYATEMAVEQTAIEYTHSVLEETKVLIARVEDLANRLLGATPSDAGKTGLSPSPDGKLPILRDHARSVSYRLSDAMSALDRIDRSL